jgi:phospholipid/cholesterol/gamma-HCH transport system substrate-binding protein
LSQGHTIAAQAMKDTYNAAKVGLLVLVTLAASIGIYRLVDEGSHGDEGYSIYAIFDDVQGLVVKSRVVIAGIPVGTIDKITLQGDRARVDLLIEGTVKLYANASVAQRSASLLGETLLVIRPGAPPAPPLKPGDQIAADAKPGGTDDVIKTVGEIAESVKKVTSQLERAFGTDEAGKQMSSSLKNLSEAIEAVNRTIRDNEDVVNHTLRNVEGITSDAAPRIERILAHVESVTSDINNIVRNNAQGVSQGLGRVDDTVASIERAAKDLEAVMKDVKQVSERTARGEGTIGRLTQDETLINEVEGVVSGVSDVIEPIGRLQTFVRLRSEYNFLANSFKNYVGLYIQPREDYYYRFELVSDPRGRSTFTQRQVRQSPPPNGEPEFYQQTITETRNEFRFTLQIAKRIHFATFRFGILESTGGLGLDLHFLDDHLQVNSDAFAIGESKYARVRVALAYEILQRLWIVGGVDDLINDSRDFFLGGQLHFNDEDLKSILPFVPATPSN